MSSKELEIKLHDLKDMLRMAEELSGMIENAKDELKRQMEEQNVDTLTAGAYKVTWKPVTSSRVDTSALKKDAPEIAQRYTKTTTAKRFMLAKKKALA